MERLTIADAPTIILGLQDEIRRSKDARYDHRLHAILLVANGMSCKDTGELLGDSTRTIQNWVNQFEERGFAGLSDRLREGRPPQLSEKQLNEIDKTLRSSPNDHGLQGNLWDGKTLSEHIKRRYKIKLGVRQCQRLFHKLDFRYRKPRPLIYGADPERIEGFKKTRDDD
jgi:transposase